MMRKILLISFVFFGMMMYSHAQDFGFKKGDVLLEGNLTLLTGTQEENRMKRTTYSINPQAGYFLSDKWAVGLRLGFGSESEDRHDGNVRFWTLKTSDFNIGGFARYYMLQVGSRFFAYSQGNIGYQKETYDAQGIIDLPDRNSWSAGVGIGANFFLTPRIAVGYTFTDLVGFSSVKYQDENRSYNNLHANINSFSNFFDSGQFSLTYRF